MLIYKIITIESVLQNITGVCMSKPIRRKTRVLNISVPPEMYSDIEEVAEAENRTKSELMREAFRHYQFVRRWRL
ncbi:MAG: ribbon-helix-helix protein, CopG family, partial [Gammaproteobacteria bacterium]|nr:CopG family transcriptional regulator [Phycisphaerae bacterium]NIW46986.1 ribbon-helix-helix protein, CopG family [Gammaproteobacteria bacterium]